MDYALLQMFSKMFSLSVSLLFICCAMLLELHCSLVFILVAVYFIHIVWRLIL
jgi:hypothetical protein